MIDFVQPALITLNGQALSDHNRSELEMDPERIGDSTRTAKGRLRRAYVTDKYTFSTSWDMLPATSTKTVDGNMGAEDMENFFLANSGEVTLTLVNKDGSTTNHTVLITDFSKQLVKRWGTYYYNASIELTEV